MWLFRRWTWITQVFGTHHKSSSGTRCCHRPPYPWAQRCGGCSCQHYLDRIVNHPESELHQRITWGAGVRGGSGGPLSSSSPATSLVSVSSLPGVSTSSMSHTFKISYFEFEQLRWNHHLGLAYQCALFSFLICLTSLDWEFGVVTRVGEGSLSLHGESTAGEERWEGESSDALGGASGVVG